MVDFVVRKARPDDAAQIITHMKLIADEPNNGTALSSSSEFTRTEEEQAKLNRDYENNESGLIVVAEANDQVIGLANCFSSRLGYKHTFDLGITVHHAWRDKGVGTALMRFMIEWCQNNPTAWRLELWVFNNNPRALHVYEKLGFEHEGVRRKSYLKHGEMLDLILMGMLFER
jgi:RimJ/RimL family protein N-acetyltransferase